MLSAYSSVMFGPPIRSGIEPLRLRAAALAADHFTRILRARERDPAKF